MSMATPKREPRIHVPAPFPQTTTRAQTNAERKQRYEQRVKRMMIDKVDANRREQ